LFNIPLIVLCYQDATEYYNLLLKKVGVDCHDTFMNTGKLFTIQGKLAEARKEKTERVAMVKHMEMQRAGSEVVEGDTHSRNDYTTAQCNFDIAKKANASAVERVFTIKNVLVKLKADVNVVFAFLLSTSATLPPAPITVNNLPDLAEPAKFGKVQSVSEFRVYRSRTILPISHTLQQLQDYEEYFDQEFAQVGSSYQISAVLFSSVFQPFDNLQTYRMMATFMPKQRRARQWSATREHDTEHDTDQTRRCLREKVCENRFH